MCRPNGRRRKTKREQTKTGKPLRQKRSGSSTHLKVHEHVVAGSSRTGLGTNRVLAQETIKSPNTKLMIVALGTNQVRSVETLRFLLWETTEFSPREAIATDPVDADLAMQTGKRMLRTASLRDGHLTSVDCTAFLKSVPKGTRGLGWPGFIAESAVEEEDSKGVPRSPWQQEDIVDRATFPVWRAAPASSACRPEFPNCTGVQALPRPRAD